LCINRTAAIHAAALLTNGGTEQKPVSFLLLSSLRQAPPSPQLTFVASLPFLPYYLLPTVLFCFCHHHHHVLLLSGAHSVHLLLALFFSNHILNQLGAKQKKKLFTYCCIPNLRLVREEKKLLIG
jgi:hypothetical protein